MKAFVVGITAALALSSISAPAAAQSSFEDQQRIQRAMEDCRIAYGVYAQAAMVRDAGGNPQDALRYILQLVSKNPEDQRPTEKMIKDVVNRAYFDEQFVRLSQDDFFSSSDAECGHARNFAQPNHKLKPLK
ncbi:hypothetical protein [Paraburkholderia sp. MM6662-R1]|uniref:hypothetical protein n=1 Tax=Paraburkholderia sp. MM6662-R1 TaxID=2991066 RepID=UPI003D1EA627